METPSDCGDIAKSKEECLVKVNTLSNNNLIKYKLHQQYQEMILTFAGRRLLRVNEVIYGVCASQ